MKEKQGNLVFGSILLILSIIMFFIIIPKYISLKAGVIVGPEFFPKVATIVVGLGGLLLVISSIPGLKGAGEKFEFNIKEHSGQIIFFVSALLYVSAIKLLGFIIASLIYLFLTLWFFGARKISRNIIITIAYIAVVYLVFVKGLRISFPPGILGF